LQRAAAEWDATTERLGVDSQREAYQQFLKLPGASADNTIEKLGLAVQIT
jgi:multiple sugar transport system substrate-binding protein